MADPKVRFKRSSVPGKIPNETQVPLGEIALNTYDGKVFASKNVGIGTTVFVVNPWNVGAGTDAYDINFSAGNVGIGSTLPASALTVSGDGNFTGIVTASGGFNLGISSAGTSITSGPVTALNFIGAGNTFSVNGTVVDISIAGGTNVGSGISALSPASNYIITLTPSFNGITTAFTMQYNGSNYIPKDEQQLLVSLAGVIQEPVIAYTVNSSTLTFASAPNSESDYFITALNTAALSRNAQSYNVTGVQTNFTLTNGYTIGYVDVYLNGSRLVVDDDYTATDGTTVGLTSAAQNGDVVEVVGYKAVSLTSGDLVISGNLEVTGITTLSGVVASGIITASSFVGSLSGNASSATYATTSGISTYATTAGIATYATSSGISTYADTAGVSTNVSGGTASVTSLNVSGISTLGNVQIGTGNTTLIVDGDARITGILTVGTASVTIDGENTQINVGSATTISTSGFKVGNSDLHSSGLSITNINATGVVTATTFSGSGASLTNLNASNLSSGIVPAARITSTSALSVGGDLYVSGNISFGGTTTQLNTSQLTFSDPDIVLGVGTTSTFNPTDNTANHGGIAIASTEGYPLVDLNIAPAEVLPATYKKIMWFKNNTAGLGTDAWLSNYAVGIGSTQFPTGTRFASGTIQFGESDINVVRNINSSGIVTASSFVSSVSTGTAPLSVGSSTVVTNLNADLLDGIQGASFLRSDADDTTTGQVIFTKANNTANGGGQIYLNGATGNRIDFNGNGFAAPSFTTRSAGTKLVLFPAVSGSQVDYALGIESNTLWYSIPGTFSNQQHRWYAGTTQLADLKGSGELVIGSTSLTGTASQRLQVTGGAYVSGNVGIGNTNPETLLHLSKIGSNNYLRINAGSSASLYSGIQLFEGNNLYGWELRHDASDDKFHILQNPSGTVYNPNYRTTFHVDGTVSIGSSVVTGTSDQKLQVTGGAYVSGGVGIGTTSPQSNLHILRQVNPGLPPQSSIVIKLDSSNSSGTYIDYSLNNGSTVYTGNYGGSFTVAKTLPGLPSQDVQFNVVGNADISGVTTSSSFVSTVSTGTAPFTVDSTTKVTNLNADYLDGISSANFLRSDVADSKTAGHLTFNDGVTAYFGTGSDLAIYHDGSNSVIQVPGAGTGNLYIRNQRTSGSIYLQADDSGGTLRTVFAATGASSAAELYYQGLKKLETTSAGVSVTGTLTVSSNTLVTNLNADLLDGIDSGSFLRSDAADTKTAGNLTFNDNVYALFGTGSDLAIAHNGSNSVIDVQGGATGDLYIRNLRTSGSIYLQADDSGGTLRTVFAATGASSAAELYYQGSKKFETTSAGVSVTGEVGSTALIYTTGTAIEAGQGSGSVALTTNDGYGNANLCFNHRSGTPDTTGSSGRITCGVDGASANMSFQLKSSTTSGVAGALTTLLYLTETGLNFQGNCDAHFDDLVSAYFGDGDDLQIYHSGTESVISDSSVNGLSITSSAALSNITIRVIDLGNINLVPDIFTQNAALYLDSVNNTATLFNSGLTLNGGNLLPATTNTGAVGISTQVWNSAYFTNAVVNGTLSVRAALDLADNDILRLGSGDDWEFFHNGTNNYIDLNTGDLIIRQNTTTRFTFERTTGKLTANTFESSYGGVCLDITTTTNVRTATLANTNASFAATVCFHEVTRSANAAFSFEKLYSGGTTDLEFNLRGDGNAYADGSWNGGGADYAEYFEWLDGNPNEEDRRGYSVVLEGDKIRVANEGEEPIGVISGNPSVVGDAAWNKWSHKYLTDDFGTYITETHKVIEWEESVEDSPMVDAVYDENGDEVSPEIPASYKTETRSYEDWNLPEGLVIPENAVYKTHDENGNLFTHRALNPSYDPDLVYVPREERPEWDAVGIMGKLRLRKGQAVGSRWIKMKDISDAVEEWLVR